MTSFNKNYFYDLPEELQHLIMKKQYDSVLYELQWCLDHKWNLSRIFHTDKKMYQFAKKTKMTFEEFLQKRKIAELFRQVERRYSILSSYKYTYGRSDHFHLSCPVRALLLGDFLYYGSIANIAKITKQTLLQYLQQNNQTAYKSWTKQRLIVTAMNF